MQRVSVVDPNKSGLQYLKSLKLPPKKEKTKTKYAEEALKKIPSLSSMDQNEHKRTACSGFDRTNEKALLAMLGSKKFEKKQVVSEASMSREEAMAALEDADGNLNVASANLGITKSSLKRKISSPTESPVAYNEANPNSLSRKYLEDNFGSWKVQDFNAKTRQACLKMTNPSCTVTLSVTIPKQSL
jgi:hypothetical protein